MRKTSKNLSNLQKEYLQTGDMNLVESLYRQLVAIGLTVQRESKDPELNQDPDAVLDIASSVCIRLIKMREMLISPNPVKLKKEVIVTYASAYMKKALFFMNKNTFHDSLDEREFEAPTSNTAEGTYDSYIDELNNKLHIDPTTEVGALVNATLRSGMSLEKVARELDPETEKKYRHTMMGVERYVKENLQGTGVYKAD